jgi:2-polyprenyl-3-methyl-5-hydroxy-6-metoxy-1,4-benzoquinol methylase
MFKDITNAIEKPSLYKKMEGAFWDDHHISKQMLKAHLDPDFEGASRKEKFIKESVIWINEIVPSSDNPLLLDICCGPGVYAEKFTKLGYQVTGIDFSLRSINFGRTSAKNQNLDINYIYENYLDMNLQEQFDFLTMIYCDYGALSTNERKILMKKMFLHLKPHGKLLLDVFTMNKFDDFEEKQT